MKKKSALTRRERVMKTALEMVANGGFHSSPMSELAAQSGVAVGTIYHHFKSKDDLIVALYHQAVQWMAEAAAKEVESSKPSHEVFSKVWLALLEHHVQHAHEFFFLEQFKYSPFIASVGEVTAQPSMRPLLDFFKHLDAEKKIVKMRPALVLEFFLCSVATAAHEHLKGGKHKLNEAQRMMMVNMAWSAMKSS